MRRGLKTRWRISMFSSATAAHGVGLRLGSRLESVFMYCYKFFLLLLLIAYDIKLGGVGHHV